MNVREKKKGGYTLLLWNGIRTGPLDSLALLQQIANLGRQHQGTSVVPPVKVHDCQRRLLWQILLDEVSSFREYL